MSRSRVMRDDGVKAAAAQAAAMAAQRLTCEGCAQLRALRPMCQEERSPKYRQAIDAHHERCIWYAVKGQTVKPAAPEPAPASRAAIAGEVAHRKHNRWARGQTA